MAVTVKTITDTWQAITSADESGSCWLVEKDILAGKVGQGDVYIYHSAIAAPTGDDKLAESKRLYTPMNNDDTMTLTKDSAADVYYARCYTTGSQAKIAVDVV